MSEKIYSPSDAKLSKFELSAEDIAGEDATVDMVKKAVANGEMNEARQCLGIMVLKVRGMAVNQISQRTGIKHSALTEKINIGTALARTGSLAVIQIVKVGKLSAKEIDETTKSVRADSAKVTALESKAFQKVASKKIIGDADGCKLNDHDYAQLATETAKACKENEEPTTLEYLVDSIAYVATGLGYKLKDTGRATDGTGNEIGAMGIEFHMKRALADAREIMSETPDQTWELTPEDVASIMDLLNYLGIWDIEEALAMVGPQA